MIFDKQLIKVEVPREKHWVGDGFYVSTIFSIHSENHFNISPFKFDLSRSKSKNNCKSSNSSK